MFYVVTKIYSGDNVYMKLYKDLTPSQRRPFKSVAGYDRYVDEFATLEEAALYITTIKKHERRIRELIFRYAFDDLEV